ncbi:MAG TPA: hypothetical protein VFW30_05155 [Bryocella sp.]|nr:hypothetical protein [Bryocella sp.]
MDVVLALPPHYRWIGARGWVLWFHGYKNFDTSMIYGLGEPMGKALLKSGYILVGPDYRNNACFGNAPCVDDIRRTVELAHSQLHLKRDPYCVGWSMGGIIMLNSVAHGVVRCRAAEMVFPAYNLASIYAEGWPSFTDAIQKGYGFHAADGYAAATAGYDPALDAPSSFRSIPMDIHCSATDVVLQCANNGEALAKKLGAKFTPCQGAHGDASCIVPDAAVALFKEH